MHPYFKTFIADRETPISLYTKLAASEPYSFLLESVEQQEPYGRYSIIGFNPLSLVIFSSNDHKNPLETLKKLIQKKHYKPHEKISPFQAGFVGYFSYEVVRHFEKINIPTTPTQIPEGIFFLPKYVIVFDHAKNTITFISYSQKDLETLFTSYKNTNSKTCAGENLPLQSKEHFANETPAIQNPNFINMVKKAKSYIAAGEIFQVVLSQTYTFKTKTNSFDLYRKLRLTSPSPYMYYLKYPDFEILGSSPETLIRVEKNEIIIRPIAGTRPRGKTEIEDLKLEHELKNDTKELAEHAMLVDLARNDIGRVSKPGSIRIKKFMHVEKFSHVMHLVSEIRGEKEKNVHLSDIFQAVFPAGTLTGAPKIRAIEIIAELEKNPRGIYGGAVGYFDLTGNMDFAIAIRTLLSQKGILTLKTGAGIVADSIAESELKECFHKAQGPLTAIS